MRQGRSTGLSEITKGKGRGMTKFEEKVWGAIVLGLLYLTGAITAKLYSLKVEEVYKVECTEIHKADSSPRGCDD